MIKNDILGIYLFGSVARGDFDHSSDLDILIVINDNMTSPSMDDILPHIPDIYKHMDISISSYGKNRITEIFSEGELFAWHIYREAITLYERDWSISELGSPKKYSATIADVSSFVELFDDIPNQINQNPSNVIYEFGLIYICLRNIAMTVSAALGPEPDFSRYSPFRIRLIPPPKISVEEYDAAMTCRLAGQRGLLPPLDITATKVLSLHERLSPWIHLLGNFIDE